MPPAPYESVWLCLYEEVSKTTYSYCWVFRWLDWWVCCS